MSYTLNTYELIKAWKRISEFALAEVAEDGGSIMEPLNYGWKVDLVRRELDSNPTSFASAFCKIEIQSHGSNRKMVNVTLHGRRLSGSTRVSTRVVSVSACG